MNTCPNCGYCPHCGRRNTQPYNPYPYWGQPQWYIYPNVTVGGLNTSVAGGLQWMQQAQQNTQGANQ